MINVGIVGGTGYTGAELLRLLVRHPGVRLRAITSRTQAGVPVADLFPNLRGETGLGFGTPDESDLGACDLVFFATPNGTAMKRVPELMRAGVRVIDLAADYRLADVATWEHWYGMTHTSPDVVPDAVYGLPEVNRSAIREAKLVANPGCYPTSVQLGFLPLVESGLVDVDRLIADAKSGASGAGRGANVANLLAEAGENLKAYAVSGHRHLPEIRQGLERAAGQSVGLTFVPHLIPMIRGIHATLYARLVVTDADLQGLFEARYRDEPFVDVLPPGRHPETRSVRGSNHCRIALHRPQDGDTVVVLSVIDNLVKGAAGQAVQNMNIMFGLPETEGLKNVALLP
jgi:N-acetyl-gamma-glutamyl-phosphate reductase